MRVKCQTRSPSDYGVNLVAASVVSSNDQPIGFRGLGHSVAVQKWAIFVLPSPRLFEPSQSAVLDVRIHTHCVSDVMTDGMVK